MNNVSLWEQRRRKALLVLPILVIPFVTLAFWALRGGKGGEKGASASSTGLNLFLPEAIQKKETGLDKLRFYEAADRDSAAWRRKMRQDRYSLGYRDEPFHDYDGSKEGAYTYDPAPPLSSRSSAETEKLIYQKLGEINKQVAKAEHIPGSSSTLASAKQTDPSQLVALQKLSASGTKESAEDKEILELNQMMEKIMDIQHPERVKTRLQPADTPATSIQPIAVSLNPNNRIAYFGTPDNDAKEQGKFYIAGADVGIIPQEPGLMATLYKQQEVGEGTVVQLKILRPLFLQDISVPAGTMVHGTASIREDRLTIHVPAIVLRDHIYPVAMKVYDLDGLEGIYVPRSQGRRTVYESLGSSSQSVPLISADPSLRAQAATAGIQAVKSLVGRKVRQVKVVLPAGYQVILKQSK